MVCTTVVMKIVLCIGGALLVVGSTLVTIAALFSPREYKGDRKVAKTSVAENKGKDDAK